MVAKVKRKQPAPKKPVGRPGKRPTIGTNPNLGLGYIAFESYDPHFACVALLGDGNPIPTDGYGGWQSVARIRRRGLTEWQGNNPLVIDIMIIFDGFAEGKSQESAIRQLEKMAGLEQGMREPPLLTFDSGGLVPHDATDAAHNDWVISDIKWGDADRDHRGNRTRQAATVTVMQYIEEDALSMASPAQRRRRKQNLQKKKGRAQRGAKEKRYVVGNGETLESIAAKPHSQGGLGKSSRWHELKKLNPRFRDAKRILDPGTILNMP